MASAINTAIITNRPRQPSVGMSHCTGRVEATMPVEPLISIQELVRSCTSELYQRR